MQATKRRFRLYLNLDDPAECEEFIEKYGTLKGRALANRLGLQGKGSATLANYLSGYAWNRHAAMNCRLWGMIDRALIYEGICERIYTEDIQPICECW